MRPRITARVTALLAAPALALLAATAPAVATPAAAAVAGTWHIQKSADVTVPDGRMDGVSCTSPDACIAVGNYISRAGMSSALAKQWNGTSWSLLRVPSPAGASSAELFGVSCATAGFCVAVGDYRDQRTDMAGLAEVWDGTSWSPQPVPAPAGATFPQLLAVSCVSPRFCEATGSYQNGRVAVTLAEVWRGSSWKIQSAPSPAGAVDAQLSGVSCLSTSFCEAVGYSSQATGGFVPMADAWDGTSWQAQAIPGSAEGPVAVSCVSATFCAAVGQNASDVWTGTSWTAQPVPEPTGATSVDLTGVSCVSANFCAAVGSYVNNVNTSFSLGMAWHGSSWAVQSTPNPARVPFTALAAVSCTTPAACAAGGRFSQLPAANQLWEALAEHWNGTSWQLQPIPARGATTNRLKAISCVSADFCQAVGSYENPVQGVAENLAEEWQGTSWRVQATPQPASFGSALTGLDGVSCVSVNFCEAVGYDPDTFGAGAMAWNGTSWQRQTIQGSDQLESVSCVSASFCEAVGSSLAEKWDGTSWQTQTLTGSPLLGDVSCVSPTRCVAVGGSTSETWNGSKWSAPQPIATPPNGDSAGLGSVSCISAAHCEGAGGYDDLTAGGHGRTLAEVWNGSTWAVQPTPNVKAALDDRLSGVWCTSASYCAAIGNWSNDTGGAATLAQVWNGTSWSAQHTPATSGGQLNGVSCAAPATCVAAGSDLSPLVTQALVEAGG